MRKNSIVATCVLLLAASSTVFAQAVAGLGGITGAVRDASNAAIPDATVVLTNESKGIRRTLQTTDAGVFAVPALTPAPGYSLAVTKDGFAKWEAKAFEILVGQTIDFKVSLAVASTSTEVQVTAEAPLVEENKTGVSQVVEQTQIDNLPINGRRADSFVLLTPAVTDDGTFGLVSFRGVAAGNAFLTDGNDTTESFYNENAGRTRISTQISQDAVQEFQVLSNGFSAEFGRAMGGVINTVTRSGANAVHGTAYWFFRNRTLEAKDRYSNNVDMPEWRHQAGASLGGPIKKDKLFYFVNFEMVKRNFPALNRLTNTSLSSDGNTVTATCDTSAGKATPAQCAAATDFIQKQMNVLVPRDVNSYMGFAKLDWRPSDRNSFSFSSNVMHWRSLHGIQTQAVLSSGAALGDNGNSTVETRYGKASWTSIPNASSVNEFRFGWFKDRLSDPASGDLFPSETGPLYISLYSSTLGASRGYPRTQPSEQRFQFVDNYSWTAGAHSAKFGVDFATTEDYIDQLYNRNGAYTYTSLTSFAMDFSGNTTGARNYSNFQQAFGNPIQRFHTRDIALYGQDVWKIGRKFTLNYGMRYEHTWLPQPFATNSDYPQTGRIPRYNRNFSPRVGFSYAFDDKTVLRGGYGIFWARYHGYGLDTLLLGNGIYQSTIYVTPTTAGAPTFPNVFTSAEGLPSGTVNLGFAADNFHNPYTQQGTLAVERQIGSNLGLTVSYIWSRGVGLWVQRDANLADPTSTATYSILDSNGNTTGAFTTPVYTAKVDSRYGKILVTENGASSWYNGLSVQLRKRLSHGLSGSVAYTWSHAIDNGNEQGASWNLGWNYNNATYNGLYALDRASSTLDQRHRAVINFVWTPKFTDSNTLLARNIINGWELSGITTLASAHPTSGTIYVTSTTQGSNPKMVYTTLNGSGGWNRVPFWSGNSLDIDQTYRVDARLSRKVPINERFSAYLMFEAFNLTNTITNTAVKTQAYTASGGALTPTAGLGTGSSSQGFPDGTNARRMQVALRLTF